eukprot:SAG31_NODE_13227_length_884_cov_0.982166_1_plen_73_part_10
MFLQTNHNIVLCFSCTSIQSDSRVGRKFCHEIPASFIAIVPNYFEVTSSGAPMFSSSVVSHFLVVRSSFKHYE